MKQMLKQIIPDDNQWHTCPSIGMVRFFGLQNKIVLGAVAGTQSCIWYENPAMNWAVQEYRTFPTGADIPDDAAYIATGISPDSFIVAHLYARTVMK